MRIGIPKEIKTLEGRIALTPDAVEVLANDGHEIFIQEDAELAAGYQPHDYFIDGVTRVETAEELYGHAELIVKVKEPIKQEYDLLRSDHTLFSYLHLAAEPELTQVLLDKNVLSIGFETVQEDNGSLPLLTPMSNIAGRLATMYGANLLTRPNNGQGILLGGLASTERGNVVIIGGGVSGYNAAVMAAGMGANVTVLDINPKVLEHCRNIGPNVTAIQSYPSTIHKALLNADLVIGAVLITGKRAPHVVTESMVRVMKRGSVIVDISIDQGGCIETSRPTTYENPTYEVHGVTHFCVTNMPGAVPRTASEALSAAILPYVRKLASRTDRYDIEGPLCSGVNTLDGQLSVEF